MNFSAVSRAFAAGVAVVLLALVPGAAVAAEPEPVQDDSLSVAGDTSAVDRESAQSFPEDVYAEALGASSASDAQFRAAETGRWVEDLSQRTESSSVFALPGGAWQVVIHGGVEWILVTGDGTHESDWARNDVLLVVRADGALAPTAHESQVAFSPGGSWDGPLASAVDPRTGEVVEMTWPFGALPKAEVDGARATYANIFPGVDLILEVTRGGYEQFFVMHDEQALAYADQLTLGFDVAGASVVENQDGGLSFMTDEGVEFAAVPTATAWDTVFDLKQSNPVLQEWSGVPRPGLAEEVRAERVLPAPAGRASFKREFVRVSEATTEHEVDLQVEVGEDSVDVTLSIPRGLQSGGTAVFPIVIDPQVVLTPSFDTRVVSGWTGNYSGYNYIQIGNHAGANRVSRSFINLDTLSVQGLEITAASLRLQNYVSYSCAAHGWYVYATSHANSSTVWTNQPGQTGPVVSSTQTRGNGCATPAGAVYADILPIAQMWSESTNRYQGLGLRAVDENSDGALKNFYSMEAGSLRPTVFVQYDRAPDVATVFTLDNAVHPNPAASPEDAHEAILEISALRPTLRATVTDPDGGNVQALFSVYQDGALILDREEGAMVVSGNESWLEMPMNLVYGSIYTVHVWAFDDLLESSESLKATWSFRISAGSPVDIPPVCDAFADPTDLCDKLGVSS